MTIARHICLGLLIQQVEEVPHRQIDIDEMQSQIFAQETLNMRLHELWRARSVALPERYLGERNGWSGVDRDRLTIYRRTGQIATR